jgi:hypothetical protein
MKLQAMAFSNFAHLVNVLYGGTFHHNCNKKKEENLLGKEQVAL